ncbi:MAG: hypothetical protein ACOCUR_02005, partial [Nanoarchaeota archaeon]
MVFGYKNNSSASRGRKTAQQKRKEKRRQRLGIAGLVFAGVLAGYGIERGVNYVSSNWSDWFCGGRTEVAQNESEPDQASPVIPDNNDDDDNLYDGSSEEPVVDEEPRQQLETLDDLLGRYTTGEGNINANLLAYDNGNKF